jgi:hypothetical protein
MEDLPKSEEERKALLKIFNDAMPTTVKGKLGKVFITGTAGELNRCDFTVNGKKYWFYEEDFYAIKKF